MIMLFFMKIQVELCFVGAKYQPLTQNVWNFSTNVFCHSVENQTSVFRANI